MPLKTLVKAGSITNLSDARYCAGMGVDMLGFRVVEGQGNYIPPKLYQEIRGWVSGPLVVAEMYGATDATDFTAISEQYAPDFFEMAWSDYARCKIKTDKPLLVRLSASELEHLNNPDTRVAFWLVSESTASSFRATLEKLNGSQLLVSIATRTSIPEMLSLSPVKGITIEGSPELRPGYKDYDDIAEILESLDQA
jgi:phosphoribosylanthranilate isomerase